MLTLNPFLFFLFFLCNFYFFSLFLAFGFFFFPSPCGLSLAATFVFDLDSSLFCLIVFLSPKVFLAFAFVFVCHRGSFWPIGADLFQLLRDSCCNKQPSRLSRFLFLFFSSLCGWRLKCSSSSSLRPSYRHILTSSSSVHLLLLLSTKWLVYGDNGVWFLFHYETWGKKNVFGRYKGCSQ